MASHEHSQAIWKVDGMTCANCAQGIRNVLVKKGLTDASVNFATGEVQFEWVESLTEDQIRGHIEKLGYTVVSTGTEAELPAESRFSPIEKRFFICLVFTLPLLAHMVVHLHWLHHPWVQLGLCLPVLWFGGRHFVSSAWSSLKTGIPNMDVLVSMGALSAFVYSLAGTLMYYGRPEAANYLFFETSASIITLVLLGNVLEQRSVKQTGSALRELAALQPETALRIEHGHVHEVAVKHLRVGDLLQVNEGSRIPADGMVVSGDAQADEHMMTGESIPVAKTAGSSVIGGTLVASGHFTMKVERTGSNSILAGILTMVKKAQNDKPPVQKLGDSISAVFVPVVIGIALLTLIVSRVMGLEWQASIMHSIAVLVISCPCAMGLATPTAVMAGLGRAARLGVLFRSGTDAEMLAKSRIWVFDKTGTLTEGQFRLHGFTTYASHADAPKPEAVIQALEAKSSHPIAVALRNEWNIIPACSLHTITEVKGQGMQGYDAEGNLYAIGNRRFYSGTEVLPAHTLYVFRNGLLWVGLDLEDRIRDGALETVKGLQNRGMRVIMLSGDRKAVCEAVAQTLGITEVYAECLPGEKLAHLEQWRSMGCTVMVGDGINDAPALHAADVSVSFSEASSVALHSAGVVLTSGKNLSTILTAFALSKLTLRTIHQNLFWAFFYNVIAIPIAATGFLSPTIAALSMAFSDVVVIGNSLWLKRKTLPIS